MKIGRWLTAGLLAGLLTVTVGRTEEAKPAPVPAGFDRPLVIDRHLERKVTALEEKAAALEAKVAALEQTVNEIKEQVAKLQAAAK